MNRKHFAIPALMVIASLVLAACGGGGTAAPGSFAVKGTDDFKFDPPTLTAKVGQSVTITFQNAGSIEHSFVIDELNVKIEKVQPGQSGTATFTPAAAGTYTFYCDVPGHKEAGMKGTITVNP